MVTSGPAGPNPSYGNAGPSCPRDVPYATPRAISGQQTLPHPIVSLRLPGSQKAVSGARILTCLKAWSLPNWEKPWAEQARETWVRVRRGRKAFLPSAPSKPPPCLFRDRRVAQGRGPGIFVYPCPYPRGSRTLWGLEGLGAPWIWT